MMRARDTAVVDIAPLAPPLTAIDALPGHIAVLDAHGVILAVNEAWRQFAQAQGYRGNDYGIGTSYLEACGSTRDSKTRSAREAVRVITDVLSGALHCGSFDYPCHTPERKHWFRMIVSPWPLADQRGALVMHFDVTEECEQREANIRMLRALRMAGGVNKSLAGIIHDVKSPLNAIAGLTDFMRSDLAGPTTQQQREYMAHVLEACDLVRDLIDCEVRRLFEEEIEVEDTLIDVAVNLRGLAEILSAEAANAGICLETTLPARLPKLAIPSVVLSRIVGNLVTNAIRYAGTGARVVVSAEAADGELIITVADNGVGIPEDELHKLTRPLHRGGHAQASGTGLGLAVVRDLAANHGAVFAAGSAPGKGLYVTVTFGAHVVVPTGDDA